MYSYFDMSLSFCILFFKWLIYVLQEGISISGSITSGGSTFQNHAEQHERVIKNRIFTSITSISDKNLPLLSNQAQKLRSFVRPDAFLVSSRPSFHPTTMLPSTTKDSPQNPKPIRCKSSPLETVQG